MLFRSAFRRELIHVSGTVFAALFTVTVTMTLVRLLGRAAGGKESAEILLPLIAFQAIGFLPVILTLTAYIAVLTVMTRAWRDSEMAVWFASGQSLFSWLRPVLGFVLPLALIITYLAVSASPWAQRQTERYRQQVEDRQDASKIQAGQFRESSDGRRVFFIENPAVDSGEVGTVFIVSEDNNTLAIVVAATGRLERRANGQLYAILEQGRRYDGNPDGLKWQTVIFDRYEVRIEEKTPVANRPWATVRAVPTHQLWREPTPLHLGELAWRIAAPVSCLLLALLAIPLSAFNVRVGRSLNLVVALLIYLLYSNALSLMQASITQQKISFEWGFWPAHAAMLLIVSWLFYKRTVLRRSLVSIVVGHLRRNPKAPQLQPPKGAA